MILFYSNRNTWGPPKLRPVAATTNEWSDIVATDFLSSRNAYYEYDFLWAPRYKCSNKRNIIDYSGATHDKYQCLLPGASLGVTLYRLLIASSRRKPKERKE